MHRIPKLKCFSSRLAVTVAQSNEVRCSVENEDVVRAALTGDAPTTSEWSKILLPTKVQHILETLRYFYEDASYDTKETIYRKIHPTIPKRLFRGIWNMQ